MSLSDMEPKSLSSNWKKLRAALRDTEQKPSGQKRKRKSSDSYQHSTKRPKGLITQSEKMGNYLSTEQQDGKHRNNLVSNADKVNQGLSPTAEIGKYVAMDCEMVGVGRVPDDESALARVSIVNFNGDQVYDSYVKVKEKVTDWRTPISGIMPKHMTIARSLEQVQRDVAAILEGNVLVGHAIRHDLDALFLSHSKRDIRDTSKHHAYRKLAGGRTPSLKKLAKEVLGVNIQTGSHSSVEDARVTMLLYRQDKAGFEKEHAKRFPVRKSAQNQVRRKKKKGKK
ncbi:MAG: 3'-5' exonuclease [Cirrosporium novae-zelandiae]|nr:MAG: 3'-5' exonuclease [Cirrosporium novae-zelandiae]